MRKPSARQIRKAAKQSQKAVSLAAGVSVDCLTRYEMNDVLVEETKRARLDAVYAAMASEAPK